jgi:hypothetical protein
METDIYGDRHKLYQLDTLEDGTILLADNAFGISRNIPNYTYKDGIVSQWKPRGKNGLGFYPIKTPCVILGGEKVLYNKI